MILIFLKSKTIREEKKNIISKERMKWFEKPKRLHIDTTSKHNRIFARSKKSEADVLII